MTESMDDCPFFVEDFEQKKVHKNIPVILRENCGGPYTRSEYVRTIVRQKPALPVRFFKESEMFFIQNLDVIWNWFPKV